MSNSPHKQTKPSLIGYYHCLDERQRATVDAMAANTRPSLWRVAVHLLSHCSLACQYCHVRQFPSVFTTVMDHASWLCRTVPRCLSTAALRTLISDIAEIGARHVHFTGGEPTLIDDLPDLLCQCSHSGLSTSLVTSGASPNAGSSEYRGRLLGAGLGAVSVSLDSADAQISDRMSGVPGAHADSVACIRSLVAMRGTRTLPSPRVYIQMLVDSTTIGQLLENLRFVGDLGVDDVKILLPKHRPDSWLTHDTIMQFRQQHADQVIAVARTYGFHMVIDDIKTLLMDDTMIERLPEGRYYRPFSGPCYMSLSELTIASNGDVYPCVYHMWDGASGHRPSILRQRFRDIVYSNVIPIGYQPICAVGCTRRIVEANRAIHRELGGRQGAAMNHMTESPR